MALPTKATLFLLFLKNVHNKNLSSNSDRRNDGDHADHGHGPLNYIFFEPSKRLLPTSEHIFTA